MALTDPTGYAPAGPLETAPSGPFTGKDARLAAFMAALDGAELGAYDRRIVDWLVGLDDTTNRTIVSLIWRAREAATANSPVSAPDPDCGVCGHTRTAHLTRAPARPEPYYCSECGCRQYREAAQP